MDNPTAPILGPKDLEKMPTEKLRQFLKALEANQEISETELACAETAADGLSKGMTADQHRTRLNEVLTETMLVREAIDNRLAEEARTKKRVAERGRVAGTAIPGHMVLPTPEDPDRVGAIIATMDRIPDVFLGSHVSFSEPRQIKSDSAPPFVRHRKNARRGDSPGPNRRSESQSPSPAAAGGRRQ